MVPSLELSIVVWYIVKVCHSEKTKPGITFDLHMILTCVSLEKLKITCFFWSVVPLYMQSNMMG